MRARHIRHDVASVLSAAAMAVIAVGMVVGFQFATLRDELASRFSSASDTCTYKAVAEVHKDSRGNVFTVSEMGGLEVINSRNQILKLNNNGLAKVPYVNNNMVFDPKRRLNYAENDKASVTLKKLDVRTWKVQEIFCEEAPGSVRGCPIASEVERYNREIAKGSRNGLIIPEFRVNCGVDVTYGWVLARKTDAPRATATPRPTSTPRPTGVSQPTSIPRPTATPRITQPPIGGPGAGRGNMEVQVVALNYPQRTSLWPNDHVANYKPASCKRQGSSEDARPLYLNQLEVRATCVGGGCSQGVQSTAEADKRKGYVSFTNLDPGNYRLEMRGLNKGYRTWPGCSGVWQVKPQETNREAIIILENETSGTYELRATEKLCKDAKGTPHLIEGLGGAGANACYFANGAPTKPNPTTPPAQPTQSPAQKCTAKGQTCEDHYREKCFVDNREGSMLCHKYGSCMGIGDGTQCSWGTGSYCESCVSNSGPVPTTPIGGAAIMRINVRVDSPAIKKVTVALEPCPRNAPCEQVATFSQKGVKELKFNVQPTNVRYKVKVVDRDIVYAQALNGIRVRAERCAGTIERVDDDYEICIVKAPSYAQILVSEIKSIAPPPAPQPPAQPPRSTRCGYYLKPSSTNPNSGSCFVACPEDPFYKYCSPDYLRPYFGEFGEDVLRKAAGICWNESRGRVDALNQACLSTDTACPNGRKSCWTHDFSAGLFQINQIGVCLNSNYRDGQTRGPSCSRKPGVDPYRCLDERGLRTFEGNLLAAKDYYVRRNWKPWNYQCN